MIKDIKNLLQNPLFYYFLFLSYGIPAALGANKDTIITCVEAYFLILFYMITFPALNRFTDNTNSQPHLR